MWSFLISGCVSVNAETCRFQLYCRSVLQHTRPPYWFWQFNNYIYIKIKVILTKLFRDTNSGDTFQGLCLLDVHGAALISQSGPLCSSVLGPPCKKISAQNTAASAVMILLLTAVKEVELGCKVACRYATTAVRLKRLKKPNLCEVYAGGDQLICRDGVELDFMTCCLIYITHKRPWDHSTYSFKT